MGVMNRANKKLASGDWLNKDELIRLRTPLAIVDVTFDRAGTTQYPGENWILTFEPWDNAKFPGPTGNVRFKNLPTRQGQFEDISEQLEEQKAQGTPYIGPVAMVSGISAQKNRFKTLADVMVDEAGEILVDKKGFPRIEGELEPEPPAPVAAPVGARKPTGTVAPQSVGQLERAQAAQSPATAPAAAAAPEPQATPEAAPAPAAKRRGRPASQPAPLPPGTPPEVARHEAASMAEAAAEVIKPPANQPEVTQTIPMATATCPHCNTEIGPNRVYPAAGGGFVIMHAHCPVKQDTVILPVVLEEQGE